MAATIAVAGVLATLYISAPAHAADQRYWTVRHAEQYLLGRYATMVDASCVGHNRSIRSRAGRKYRHFGCQVVFNDARIEYLGMAPTSSYRAVVAFL